jgi:hypothetical protein
MATKKKSAPVETPAPETYLDKDEAPLGWHAIVQPLVNALHREGRAHYLELQRLKCEPREMSVTIESVLDSVELAGKRLARAEVDAGACGTREDHLKVETRRLELERARETATNVLVDLVMRRG